MAQARRVPIPIPAPITGASLTTSTKPVRSTGDEVSGRLAVHPARPIPFNHILCDLVSNVGGGHEPAVHAFSRGFA
jgi:hypothetical protein